MSIANELRSLRIRMQQALLADKVNIDFYDGTFTSAELKNKSFTPPSIFLSCASATPLVKSLGVATLDHSLGVPPPPPITRYQIDCNFAAGVMTKKAGKEPPQLVAWDIATKIPPLLNDVAAENIELTNAYDAALFNAGMFLVVVRWRKSVEVKIGAQQARTDNPTAEICINTRSGS